MSDVAGHLAELGETHWIVGDFNNTSQALDAVGWFRQVKGTLREGDRRIGTCTSSCPASSIHSRVVRRWLGHMVSEAHIDLTFDVPPPVWVVFQLPAAQPLQQLSARRCRGFVAPSKLAKALICRSNSALPLFCQHGRPRSLQK